MRTMNDFELNSHAEYAKKYPAHEVSFFEAMVIPSWAHASLGASNHSNEDLLNIMLAYQQHEAFNAIINATQPVVIILLYYRLLVYEKLLLSLEAKHESCKTVYQIRDILEMIGNRYSHVFSDQLLSEKDIRILLIILQLTRRLNDALKDPYMRFSKIKKLLARFYRLMISHLLADESNELTIIACYINPYFQNPGNKNNKITKAANEVFNYQKQTNKWIKEYPRVALIALDRLDPNTLEVNMQNALYEAALRFDEVTLALLNNPALLQCYSEEEQSELQTHLNESQAEGLLEGNAPNQVTPKYRPTNRERRAAKKQALRLYAYFYMLSGHFFQRNTLKLTANHLKDILQIITHNEKDILPIIAEYWHKTYRQFRIHSHSTEFQKRFTPYINTIINFFNDKDIGEKDDAMLKAFAKEFIGKCKNAKANLEKSKTLSKHFNQALSQFIQLDEIGK